MNLIKNLHKSFSDDDLFIYYDRIKCEESFAYFLEQAWPYIDPNVDFQPGWHIDAICEHMEAVMYGDIRKLIINVPPRTSKSSIVTIAFPAWVWIHQGYSPLCGANVQFLCGTYSQRLSNQLSNKFRSLINSEWYQKRWGRGYRFQITQDTVVEFNNDRGGRRQATSVTGAATGLGGNIMLLDDPHNAREGHSKIARERVIDWFDQTMSSRFNNPKKSGLVLVMQRLHVNDLSGHFLSKDDPEMVHLFLPMEFMLDRKCYTSIGWEDPRTKEGELLLPERMGPREISTFKNYLGPYGYVGQHQQMPMVVGGGILKAEYWCIWPDPKSLPPFDMILASLDPAYTSKQENDYSACTIWGVYRDQYDISRVLLLGHWQERLEFHELIEKLRKTIKAYNVDKMLVEAKASGLSVIQELDRLMVNSTCVIEAVSDVRLDKIARAYSIQGVFQAEYVYVPACELGSDQPMDWAQKVIYECADFPRGAHDDTPDSVTQAIRYLRDTIIDTREDRQVALQEELTYTKPRRIGRGYGI